jgi:hypothetical protein
LTPHAWSYSEPGGRSAPGGRNEQCATQRQGKRDAHAAQDERKIAMLAVVIKPLRTIIQARRR